VTDEVVQSQYVSMFKAHEMNAIIMDHSIDQPFISHMEMKNQEVKFARIDADLTDTLKGESTHNEDELKSLTETLETTFKSALGNDNIKLSLESLKSEDISAMILLAEESRRMQDMTKMYGMMGMDMGAMMPSDETLVLNTNHRLVKFIIDNKDNTDKADDINLFCQQLYDLAMISHKPLSPESMTAFINRSNQILGKLI